MNDSMRSSGENTCAVTSDEESEPFFPQGADDSDDSIDDGSVVSYEEIMHCIESLGPDPEEQVHEEQHSVKHDHNGRGGNIYANDAEGSYSAYHNHQANVIEKEANDDDCTGYYSGSAAVQVRTEVQEEVSTLGGTVARASSSFQQGRNLHGQDPSGVRASSLVSNGENAHSYHGRSRRHRVQEEPSITSRSRRKYVQEEPSVGNNNSTMWSSSSSSSSSKIRTPSSQTANAFMESLDIDFDASSPSITLVPTTSTGGGAAADNNDQQHQKRTPGITPMVRRHSRDSLMSNLSPLEEASQESSPGGTTGLSSTKNSGKSSSSGATTTKSRNSSSLNTKSSSVESGTPRKNITTTSVSAKNAKKRTKSRKGPPPPPPPRPPPHGRRANNNKDKSDKVKRSSGSPSEKKPNNGSSRMATAIAPPPPISKKITKKQTTTSTKDDSIASTSSDFEIVLLTSSDGHSVVTELTNEGFDNKHHQYNNHNSVHNHHAHDVVAAAAAAHGVAVGGTPATVSNTGRGTTSRIQEAIAAAKYYTAVNSKKVDYTKVGDNTEEEAADDYRKYNNTRSSSRQEKRQQQQRPAPRYQGLPRRMPLYNGSNASSPSTTNNNDFSASSRDLQQQAAPGQHQKQQEQEEEVHPSVEKFLASAMKQHARLSKSFGNFDEMSCTTDNDDVPLTDDEESFSDQRWRQSRRLSGGVMSSSDSGSVRGNRTRGQQGMDDRGDYGQRKKRSSASKQQSSKSSPSGSNNKLRSSLASKSEPKLVAASSSSASVKAFLDTILASSHSQFNSKSSPAAVQRRKSSMHSFFSERDASDTFSSPPGEDFAC